jgi:two-component system, sensor histidine kinase
LTTATAHRLLLSPSRKRRCAMRHASNGCRVLIIEDYRDTAETLRALLSLFGHEVKVAYDGASGVDVARAWEPDVVLSDLRLPRLDGFGVATALRSSKARLVALTAYGDEETRQRAKDSGFEQLLVKPADPDHVIELLAQLDQ